MARLQAPYVFTETRLNLDHRYAGAIVELTLPAHQPSAFSARTAPARGIISDIQIGSDEATFAKLHLANEASAYFSRHDTSPRNFLWRLLDERRALEIRAVDLSYESSSKGDAPLTLLLRFPSAVQPFGIAFAEPEERDAINVFAITGTHQNYRLYTLTLQRDFFRHLRATDPPPAEWCSFSSPPAFNLYAPYRLFAISPTELLASVTSHRILRLIRKPDDDGVHWQETWFTDGTLAQAFKRSMVPKLFGGQSPIKFGNVDLEPGAAAAVSLSPDAKFIFAVCLNHTLKTWNVETGRVVAQADLLGNMVEDEQTAAKYTIPPTQCALLRVIDTLGQSGDSYYVVIYSPKHRRFKFFGMVDEEAGTDGLRDVQSDFEFTPPIDEFLDTTIWNLEEFNVVPRKNWKETELWIRVVSGSVSKVYTITFNLFDKQKDLEEAWLTKWSAVSAGAQTPDILSLDAPPDPDSCTEVDLSVTDLWDQFLFYPGRFTVPSLETALTIYTRGTVGTSHSHVSTPLKERIFRAIVASTDMRIANDREGIAGDREEVMADQQRMFYNILKDLHRRRGQVLSFVLDSEERLPWIVCADAVSPVRTCTDLEQLYFNKDHEGESEVVVVLEATNWLRKQLSRGFLLKFDQLVMAEVLDEPSSSISDRLQDLAARSGIEEEVSDDIFDRLMERMASEDGNMILTMDNFLTPIDSMTQEIVGQRNTDLITGYGVRTLTRATQEMINLNKSALRDLMILLLLTVVEYGTEADGGQPLDLEEIFILLTEKTREYAVLDFLNSNVRTSQKQRQRRSSVSADSPGASESSSESSVTLTLMESLLISGWSTDMHQPLNATMPELITYWAQWWIASTNLATEYDAFTAHVLADLIKHQDQLLAQEFIKFVAQTGWSTYLKGRLYLILERYQKAAEFFKRCSYSLALGYFDVNQNDTSELIDLTERDNFSDGLPSYYAHIIALFEKHKAQSQILDFATLALQALAVQCNNKSPGDVASPTRPGSPTSEPSKLRLDLLSRAFTSALHTQRFQNAYTALIQIDQPDLRKSLLRTFVNTLVSQNRIQLLLSFPYTSLAADVDVVLEDLAKRTSTPVDFTGSESAGPTVRPYEVLYSFRMKQNNVQGAAQAAFERLARLKASGVGSDPRDTRIRDAYLVLINALCCIGGKEPWVMVAASAPSIVGEAEGRVQGMPGLGSGKKGVLQGRRKRGILTLEEVRREYQGELDRVSRLEQGRWGFGGDGDGDGDGDARMLL